MSSHELPTDLPFPLGMSTAELIAECQRRGYDQSTTLAVLTAHVEGITVDLDALDVLPHPTVDPWYNIAATQNIPPTEWQAFKTRLYFHIRTAGALLEGEDPLAYGLPRGTNITYGTSGFPAWVYELGKAFGLKASTYPGHQENNRNEPGFAPNPQGLNRGIDWAGPVADMQRFADYLLTVKSSLEQVIWQNPNTGQRVGVAGGKDVTTTGYYDADYPGHRDHVHTRQSAPIPMPNQEPPVPDNRPDFNEYPMWSPNSSSRGGRKIDLFLLHTQEGNGNADSLARFLQGNQVSYHYTISEDVNDHGVTVVDVVDTDNASWSVLSANPRSINLCFAGSRAAWTRAEWLKQSRAIDVAAYLAVQDCKKYGIPTKVLAPPYNSNPPGISDHKYVTQWLKDGSHTDVGPNFPWDVFTAAVNKYAGISAPAPGGLNMTPDQVKKLLEDVAYIKDQLGPGFDEWGEDGDLGRNAKGQRRTFRAGLAALMRKVGA